ncbi:hypothetical protein [Pseudomonas aeruginosa]|nr:hypothetical protein [Pseudomonas aeruginosa]AYZ82759.1 hypothetical protein EGY27_07790 [Pseudomonas aeruginosa]EIU1654919.1 hypothetical protein [Pseudomonas aeruginosa]EKU4548152.1 hypothetical protein [Pseudomonas aeruginosa]EKW2498148.1 hypothetical protein [Pseudomonas aeruginosa]EKX4039084.1 hypothetical protein [Pseudomonas aeruginosa]
MKKHPSGSTAKATTAPRHLVATAIVGGALVAFLVMKTDAARARLQSVAALAYSLGELTDQDVSVVAQLLARPIRPTAPAITFGEHHHV